MARAQMTSSRRRKPAVRGLTLVELLVVMVIISIMAGAVMGGLQKAQNAAREARTKATIAKLDHFITLRIDSYKTRRLVYPNAGAYIALIEAEARLCAMRDLMRMEMPERPEDITTGPLDFIAFGHTSWTGNGLKINEPSLHLQYKDMWNNPTRYGRTQTPTAMPRAKILYMVVVTGSAEAREQFQQNEIMVDTDGWPMFVDGWGRPIVWLRWAPSCSYNPPGTCNAPPPANGQTSNPTGISTIQSGDPCMDHDPFDPNKIQAAAFELLPLILSAAGHRDSNGNDIYGVALEPDDHSASPPTLDPFDQTKINFTYGKLLPQAPIPLHNHFIEMR